MSHPAPSEPVELSIVVVNWNSGPHLGRLLASLWAHPPSGPWEVVVVDNASSDDSLERVAGAAAPVEVIANPTNVGLAAANNQGLAATTGRAVLIANPDVEVPHGGLDRLVATLDAHPRAAVVVPRLVGPDGRPQPSAGKLPGLAAALVGRVAGRTWSDAPEPGAAARPIERGAEACYLVRRAAIDQVGPQDPRYRLDWEGMDWADRFQRAGWEVWLEPAVTVTHVGGVSIGQAGRRWVKESHRGMYLYFADRTAPWARPLLAAAIGLRGVLKTLGLVAGLPLYDWARGREARR